MAWARLDDGFFCHPKTNRIAAKNPGAGFLWVRLMSYCAKYETDGYVDRITVETMTSIQLDRDAQISVLLEEGALHEHEDGFVVSDYLDYNASREMIQKKRDADRDRKRNKP